MIRPAAVLRGSAGTTLVEMLVALVIVAYVGLAGSFIYLVNQRAFREGREKLLLQQNVSRCAESLSRDIRAAWRADVEGSGRLVLYDTDGRIAGTWEAGLVGGVTRLKRNSLAMAPEECTSLRFTANADTSAVGIEMEFRDRADNRVRLDSRAALRNFEVGS